MKLEIPPKIEQKESESRERLLALEKEGRYVFHGSPNIIDILEPRQALNNDKNTGKMEKDGEPAVFATPYADVAIFRALIHTTDDIENSTSEFGIEEDELHFSATKNLLNKSNVKVGNVYVLDKQSFQDFKSMECRSREPVKPIKIIEVNYNDLPKNIEVIET